MKVITGRFKQRNLFMPPGRDRVRLTTAFIKKVVIDIYQFKIKDTTVLDLYAGSGNVGIEFLSNGAGKSVFVEIKSEYCDVIRRNMNKLGLVNDEHYFVVNNDVSRALLLLDGKYCFDYIYMDPPYKGNHTEETINNISGKDIYNKDTVIISEHHFKEKVKDEIGEFRKFDSRQYGLTVLDFFRK